MTAQEFAEQFTTLQRGAIRAGKDYAFMLRGVQRGVFESIEIGGKVFISIASIDAWKVRQPKPQPFAPAGAA